MPPKSKQGSSSIDDDLIEALLDTRVVEALAKALAPFIALSIDESLNKRLEGLTTSIRDLKGENTRLTKRCEGVELEKTQLKKQYADLHRHFDDLEAYSRSENLIIRGLPEL